MTDALDLYKYLIGKYPDLGGWIFNFMLVYTEKRQAMLLEMLNVELQNNQCFCEELLTIVNLNVGLEHMVENEKCKRILIYNVNINPNLIHPLKGHVTKSRDVSLGQDLALRIRQHCCHY